MPKASREYSFDVGGKVFGEIIFAVDREPDGAIERAPVVFISKIVRRHQLDGPTDQAGRAVDTD